jgi:hypothetical protein
MNVCSHCGKVHSDWVGCEVAEVMGLVETLPVVCDEPKRGVLQPQTLDVVVKPKFDRVAAMAHARKFRKK